jgi:hypothetical protein
MEKLTKVVAYSIAMLGLVAASTFMVLLIMLALRFVL